jgi:diaminopimelate decarboxylase
MGFPMTQLWFRGKGLPISHLPPTEFVATGVYRYLRHPIYVGYTLAFAGAAILLHSFWSLAFSTPLLLIGWTAYARFYEEPGLIARFGGRYREYRSTTAMLLPTGVSRMAGRIMRPAAVWLCRLPGKPGERVGPDLSPWRLERRGSDLFWGGCNLAEIAREHDTPLYVVNTALLERSHQTLLNAFRDEGLEAKIFFSYKTNPVPSILGFMAARGIGAEIISEFEFWLATRLGVDGGDIVVNGSTKSLKLLRQAVIRGVAAINVESADELRCLQKLAGELGRSVNVGLRINPCLKTSRFDFTLFTGSRKSHIGFEPRSNAWQEALRILQDNPLLKLRGLHFHIGSGINAAHPYEAALNRVLMMWTELLDRGFQPVFIDIGGGFSTPTLRELNLLEAVRFFGWGRPPGGPGGPSQETLLRDIARACARSLGGFARRHGVGRPTIYVEPGRALASASQLLLLKVVSLKQRADGTHVAVCDAGALSLSLLLLSECHAVLVANKPDGGRTARYDLVGNLPAPLDLVTLRRDLPVLEAGDLIAVMDTGAYFTSLGNNFAGPRPAIVIIENGVATLARRREAFEDMVARDLPPAAKQEPSEEGQR